MKKSTIVKWILGSVAATAATAFAVGVALELKAIKKLTVDTDTDEEPQACDLCADEEVTEVTEEVAAEVTEEPAPEAPAEA